MPRSPVRICSTWLPVFGLLVAAGCGGSSIVLDEVSGRVTFAGQPVVYGTIEFIPDANAGHTGPAGRAEIVNGEYDTRNGGKGVIAGSHQVRITAYEEKPQESADETVVVESKPPICVGYTIEASVGGGTRDFDIPESARGFDMYSASQAAPSRGR
jgi:hypothetical protein